MTAILWRYKEADLTLTHHFPFFPQAFGRSVGSSGLFCCGVVRHCPPAAPAPRELSYRTVRVIWSVYKLVVCLCETAIV